MSNDLIAIAETTVHAPVEKVWDALVNPDLIKRYMFGTTVISDWKEGSPITWKGEYNGKAYEDKGNIVAFRPEEKLVYTHFSPLAGKDDNPENYHTVSIELTATDEKTNVVLTQNKNASEDEKKHSEENWKMMLNGLKRVVEEDEVKA